MTSQCFAHIYNFPKDAQEDLSKILENKKANYDRKINSIRLIQSRYPKKLFEYTQYENLIDDLLELESQEANYVYAKVYYDDLVVIYCGRHVKYGRLVPNEKKAKKSGSRDGLDLVLKKIGG
jgi:hypothetical protein